MEHLSDGAMGVMGHPHRKYNLNLLVHMTHSHHLSVVDFSPLTSYCNLHVPFDSTSVELGDCDSCYELKKMC